MAGVTGLGEVRVGGLLVVGLVLLGEIGCAELSVFRAFMLLAVLGKAMDAEARLTANTTIKNTANTAAEIFSFLFIFSPSSVMSYGLF